MRVKFDVWGHGVQNLRKIPAYAMRKQDGISAAYDVADAMARANGLVSASVRHDGGNVYQATLAKRCRSGGYTPKAEIWFRIA
jgi:hypothetical protein